MLTVLLHDLRCLFAGSLGRVIAVTFLGASGLAVWTGSAAVDQRQAAVERAVASHRATLEADRARVEKETTANLAPWVDPANPYRRRALAVLPPAPLSYLGSGMSELQPYSAEVSIYSLPSTPFRQHEIANPATLVAGRFDSAFVVIHLLPLLVLALSYDLVSGEREGGTLALARAQGAKLSTVLIGKTLARGGVVFALVLVAALAGAVLRASRWQAAHWGLLGAWVMVVGLYVAFWFALAILVQSLGRSSGENALLLLAAWIATVVVLPNAIQAGAESLHPTPSRYALVGAERRADNESSRRAAELLSQLKLDHPELLPDDRDLQIDFTKRYYAVRLDQEARLHPEVARFEKAFDSQQATVDRLRFLSPTVVANEALLKLTGGHPSRGRRFLWGVRNFIPDWQREMAPKVFLGQRMAVADFDRLPSFRFVEEPTMSILRRVLVDSGWIALLASLMSLFGLARLGRLEGAR